MGAEGYLHARRRPPAGTDSATHPRVGPRPSVLRAGRSGTRDWQAFEDSYRTQSGVPWGKILPGIHVMSELHPL